MRWLLLPLLWLGIFALLLGLMQCSLLVDIGHSNEPPAADSSIEESIESIGAPTSSKVTSQSNPADPSTTQTTHQRVENARAAIRISEVDNHAADNSVELMLERPPFSVDDDEDSTAHQIGSSGEPIYTTDESGDSSAVGVQTNGDSGDTMAAASGASFVLIDSVSTNSGINGFPEIAVPKTLVSLLDGPAVVDNQLNAHTPTESSTDKISNRTTTKPQHNSVESSESTPPSEPNTNAETDTAPIDASSELPPPSLPAAHQPTIAELQYDVPSATMPVIVDEAESQIPLFSEWAQKRMEEVEKEQEQDAANISTQKKNHTANPKFGTAAAFKLRTKNYASPDCGAKIVASNAESSNTRAVLTLTKDEYLLSPCTSRIWFVVELCEAIQAEIVDLANFELFSSSPKNFSIAVANRFPTRDWSQVGRFTALDERDIQSFDLDPQLFGRYVRVDIHSHYNSEHFCPISLFRAFGTSEFEAFETENRLAADDDVDDDDDDDAEAAKAAGSEDRNIFKSASDAVMSIVKAAATFVKPVNNQTASDGSTSAETNEKRGANSCSWCASPIHLVQCRHCSGNLTAAVADLVACHQRRLRRMLSLEFVRQAIVRSRVCASLLADGGNISDGSCVTQTWTGLASVQPVSNWVTRLLPERYLVALCNVVASDEKLWMVESTKMPTTATTTTTTAPNVTIDRKDNQIRVDGETHEIPVNVPVVEQAPVIYIEPMVEENAEEVASVEELPKDVTTSSINADHVASQISTPPIAENSQPSIESTIDSREDYIFEGDLHDKEDEAVGNIRVTLPLPESTTLPTVPLPTILEIAPTDSLAEMPVNSIVEMASELLNAEADAQVVSTTPMPLIDEGVVVVPDDVAAMAMAVGGGSNGGGSGSLMIGSQRVQSESVFLRLSNRVKSLERNMSLSGQYLEELSRRYKKQVEELQLSFTKTLHHIEEQSKRSLEREHLLAAQNERLRADLDQLHERVNSWHQHIAYVTTMLCAQLAWWLLRRLCRRSEAIATVDGLDEEIPDNLTTENQSRSARLRRKSADGSTRQLKQASRPMANGATANQSHPPQAKRRRPSEEAMQMVGNTYADLMIEDIVGADADEEYDHFAYPNSAAAIVGGGGGSGGGSTTNSNSSAASLTARQQRKQRRNVKRTMSLDQSAAAMAALTVGGATQRRSAGRRLPTGGGSDGESTAGSEPVLDENYESYVPGSDMAYNEFMPDGPSGHSTPRLMDLTPDATDPSSANAYGDANDPNAAIAASMSMDSSITSKKSDKFRRLSSPAFMKFGRASSISLGGKSKSSTNEQTTGWEWYRRKESSAKSATSAANASQVMSVGLTVPATTRTTVKSKSASPTLMTPPAVANGDPAWVVASDSSTTTLSTGGDSNTSLRSQKKPPGSFRRMLKKVF